MIDIHVHLLSGYDDGPADQKVSVDMVRLAAKDGTEVMVATPHSADWMPANEDQFPRVEADVEALQAVTQRCGLDVRLYPGAEVHIAPDLVSQIRQGHAFPLCRSRYLLLEFPFGGTPTFGDEILFELQVERLVPIIAHPERHNGVIEDPNLLCRWVQRGTLAQLNAGSLLGQFGKRVQEVKRILLEHELVHFIASDGHNTERRPPLLSAAAREAAAIVGEDRALWLTERWPAAVVDNRKIEAPEPHPVSRRRWFW